MGNRFTSEVQRDGLLNLESFVLQFQIFYIFAFDMCAFEHEISVELKQSWVTKELCEEIMEYSD